MEARTGMIVRSAAGRDKGKFMVIVSIEGDFAYIADGRERKLDKPKKKRLKHIRVTNTVVDADCMATDKGLRKLLRGYAEQSIS